MKTFKEFIKEEGYDIARDMGKVRPSKDKKDATTMPPSKEMEKTRKVNKGKSALERVKILGRGEKRLWVKQRLTWVNPMLLNKMKETKEHLVIEEVLKVVWHLLMTQRQEDIILKRVEV